MPFYFEQNVHVREKPVIPRSMVKMFQLFCHGPNFKFAVGCSDRMLSAYNEFSCLEWLIPAGELLVASDRDRACLDQGTPWGFRHGDRSQSQSKAVRCVPACLCGWVSKPALEDSEVARLHTLPRDKPRVMPAVLQRGCSSCSAAGSLGSSVARAPSPQGESLLLAKPALM